MTLLQGLCALVDAQNASWIGAVRLPDMVSDDAVHGWRPRFIHHLRPLTTQQADKLEEQRRLLEAGVVDITTVRNVALAGSFRCNRLVDLVGEEWFSSDYYHHYYRSLDYGDAVWSGCPVSADAEVYIGVFRNLAQPRFTVAERDAVAFALRGLRWFHRQSLLDRGLLVASTPLTPVEHRVLQGLLDGCTEKGIAAALQQSPNTTHGHVKAIYRKFGVSNRATLVALWLGRSA